MKLAKLLLGIKIASLAVLGSIVIIGNLGASAIGGLWSCPFPIPFVMCNVCPVHCTFGQIRVWLFYGILASGLLVGRVFCGTFCPIGVAQELAAKVPLPKISPPRRLDRALRYLKYVLALLAAGLVIEATGLWSGLPLMGEAWSFLTRHTEGMRVARIVSIPVLLVVGIFLARAGCRYLCPVGTWLSPFNRFSLVGLRRDPEKCVACRVCQQRCSQPATSDGDEDIWDSIECVRCLQCYAECQGNALAFKNRWRG